MERSRSSPRRIALPAGTWSHLAATYDGSQLRLYVNGTQVAQTAASGSIATSTAPLRIGGNAVWGEWFSGWIDEVRVYGRALSAAEIQDDMNTSVVPDTTAPTVVAKVPANLAAGVNVGTRRVGDVQRADAREHDHVLERRAPGRGWRRRPGDRELRPGDERRDADAAGGAPVRDDVHGDREGRERRA